MAPQVWCIVNVVVVVIVTINVMPLSVSLSVYSLLQHRYMSGNMVDSITYLWAALPMMPRASVGAITNGGQALQCHYYPYSHIRVTGTVIFAQV